MVNRPIQEQVEYFVAILSKNPYVTAILDGNPFPGRHDWYLGAGCICQSVWNFLSGKEITAGIEDYDLVYYDASDLSAEGEAAERERVRALFGSLPVEIDVVNEARVHLWDAQDFGQKIDQYPSCEAAINGWPTTATAIGVNRIDGKTNVYAPYGLNDLLGMVVRPNRPAISRWVYEQKVEKWTKKWPDLKVIPWEQALAFKEEKDPEEA